MDFPSQILSQCSNRSPPESQNTEVIDDGEGGDRVAAHSTATRSNQADEVSSSLSKKGKGVTFKKKKGARMKDDASSSSSSSSRMQHQHQHQHQHQQQRGVRVKSRRRNPLVSRGLRVDDSLHDLALPLGMSFAAVIAQVLDRKNIAGEKMPADRLSMICTAAVKESVTNVYGDRFDFFMQNFEKSFASTLKTLRLINETCCNEQGNRASFESSCCESLPCLGKRESPRAVEELQENLSLDAMNNQLVSYGQINQQLAHVSQGIASPRFGQSVLSTFEKSVMEQTRSNDLKAVEIGLSMKRLQLKQSQLALNSYANMLERIKITMGISKASFKEEKLKNQILDMRHAELLKTCIDLLVSGLIIMSSLLLYGAYIYSYKRITEATASCTSTPKASKSWWVPKQMASFSSGWEMLRCHVVILTRMLFGLLMILAVVYSVFRRSASSGSTMPVTFILLLLGVCCGVAGKMCIDTLGGDGYCWLLYWEALCMLHLFANVFPSTFYHILHGPVSLSPGGKVVRLPYWFRRYTFYGVLFLILPTLCGLLPFASLHDWMEHFSQKITLWSLRKEDEL